MGRLLWLLGAVSALAVLVVGAAGWLGSLPTSASQATKARPLAGNPVVLYDQYDNSGVSATSSQIFGLYYEDLDDQGADDFVVPPGQVWIVSQVEVQGQYDRRGGPADSVNVYFYRDKASLPGAPLSIQRELPYDSGPNNGSFVIPIEPVKLEPGTYWVSVQAIQDYVPRLMWYWNNRTVQSNQPAAFRNPGDGWHRGCLDWSKRAGCKGSEPGENDQVFRLLGSGGPTPTGTPPTPTPTVCGNGQYSISPTKGATIVPGKKDTGNHCIDCTTLIALPFAYRLYERTFDSARVDSNGTLQFVSNFTTYNPQCLPDTRYNYTIFAHWDDMDTGDVFCSGGCGIFTSVSGNEPNRIFNIEWRAAHSRGSGKVNFEIRLYENDDRFDLVYGSVPESGTNAVVGVQRDTGSRFTEFECLTGKSLTPGLMLTFELPFCPTPTATFENTSTPTRTLVATHTPTSPPTFTPTPSATLVRTATMVPTWTLTVTPSITPTSAATVTWTATPVPTNTAVSTPSPTPSNTPITPSLTPTSPPSTATHTPTIPPPNTSTPTIHATNTNTSTPTSTLPAATATSTGTSTTQPTATAPATATNSPTAQPTATDTGGTSTPQSTQPALTHTATSVLATSTQTTTTVRTATPGRTSTSTITSTRVATACAMNFRDVGQSDYFYLAIQHLYCRRVISGYSDGMFRPFDSTTRGQLAKMIVVMKGWTPICSPSIRHFSDVSESNPFFCFIEAAYSHQIITGYTNGIFRPYDDATRQQLSKMIVLGKGWTLTCPAAPHFSDLGTTSPFYCYVETAYAHRIILGYDDGSFRPGASTTRGQISTVLYRADTQP